MNDSTIEEIRVANVDVAEVLEKIRVWVEEAYRTQQVLDESALAKEIVLRLDVRFDWSAVEQQLLSAFDRIFSIVRERFKSQRLYVLYSSSFEIQLLRVRSSGAERLDGERIKQLRSQELNALAVTSNALYHQFGNHYYRLPSGEVSDFFFRVGNLQADKYSLDVFWFWTLPYIRGVSNIVCDTWSISTLSAYLASSAQKYSGKAQINWTYLAGYMVDDELLQRQLQEELERASANEDRVLFLLSATATGRTQTTIQSIVANGDIEPEKFVVLTLFALADHVTTNETLCVLSSSLQTLGLKGVVEEAALPPSERIYQVDPKTYFPTYFNEVKHPFRAGRKAGTHTQVSSEFFERYAGHTIFSVCKDGASNRALLEPRHHAFHINAEKLFHLSAFKKRLRSALEDTDRPYTHIVHLGENADLALVELIKGFIGINHQFIEIDDYSEIDSNPSLDAAYANVGARVLFVDSMTISGGSRLERFQIALRRLCGSEKFDPVGTDFGAKYLIGLARPSTLAKFDRLVNFFPQSSPGSQQWLDISIVEQVLLPDWHSEKCPWCTEREVLRAVVSRREKSMTFTELHYVDRRIRRLESRQGLTTELFFRRYEDDEFDFEFGSLFLDTSRSGRPHEKITDADLICATASAFQAWRNDTHRLPPATYVLPSSVTFDPTMYNETRLRAAIWRSLLPTEISLIDSGDEEIARTFLEYVYNSSDICRDAERSHGFVLGFEAALLLGRSVKRVLGEQKFKEIDWVFLQWVSTEARSPSRIA